MRLPGLSLLVLLWGAAALADVADEAEFHFRRGLHFQEQGRLEEALASFYASNRLVPNRNVQLNIAATLGRLKLYHEAFRAYSALQASEGLSPQEKQDLERALSFLRPMLALVRVETDPPGAHIYAERKDLGSLGLTPKLLALPPGGVTLLLEKEGYEPDQLAVELRKGKQVEVFRPLERILGELELSGFPEEAEVRAEGAPQLLRRGPGKLTMVPGRTVLLVSAKGFLAARVETEVPPKSSRSVTVSLVPEPPPPRRVGHLVVRANVDEALVEVDGKEEGFAPWTGPVDADRPIRVVVSKEGRETHEETVTVREHQRQVLPEIRLRPKAVQVAGAAQRLTQLEHAPASVTVISAEEIRVYGWSTVADALRSVRGLFVWSDGSRDSVGIRGFGLPENANARVLVLLDGHPVNDPIRGYGPIGAELGIDLNQVERIEVVRGGGTVFGSTAYLGLINVVPRRAEAGHHLRLGLVLTPQAGADLRTATSHQEAWGEVVALAGAQGLWGDPADTGGERPKGLRVPPHLNLFARKGPFSLVAGYSAYSKNTVPTRLSRFDAQSVSLPETRSFLAVQLDHKLPRNGFGLLRLAFDQASSTSFRNGEQRYLIEEANAEGISGELRVELSLAERHWFSIGAAGHYFPQISQRLQLQPEEALEELASDLDLNAYANWDWQIRPTLRLGLGLRVDPVDTVQASKEETSSVEKAAQRANPQLSAVAQPYPGGNLKLLLNWTLRSPSPRELSFDRTEPGRAPVGRLKKEGRIGAELEHSHALTDEISLVGALFWNRYTNLLGTRTRESGPPLFYDNLPGPTIAGAELELRYSPGDGKWLSLAHVFQGEISSAPAPSNMPETTLSARVALPLIPKVLLASTEMLFLGSRTDREGQSLRETLLWNLVLSGGHAPWNVRYHGGVYNVLDERHPEPLGPEAADLTVPRLGRQVRIGVSRSF